MDKDIVNYFFELGNLARIRRSGYHLAGIKDSQPISDHIYRASMIAFILAKLEGADPYKAAVMCLFHDNAETRIGDVNKVTARYINSKEAEMAAFKDQVNKLPKEIAAELLDLFVEFEKCKTKEAVVAKDADYIECAIQSKEYLEQGYKTQDWIRNNELCVKTATAKNLLKSMHDAHSTDWWAGLKKRIIDENDRKSKESR